MADLPFARRDARPGHDQDGRAALGGVHQDRPHSDVGVGEHRPLEPAE